MTADFKRNSSGRTRRYEYSPPPPINALVSPRKGYDGFSTMIIGIRRQQNGLVVIIWGGMIGNELTSLIREPEELNCPLTFIARS